MTIQAVLYTNGPACVQCNAMKRSLTREGLITKEDGINVSAREDFEFEEVDLRFHTETAELLKGKGFMTAPVMAVTWPGEEKESWVLGFQPERVKGIKRFLDSKEAA